MDGKLNQTNKYKCAQCSEVHMIPKITPKVHITSKLNKQRKDGYIYILFSFWGIKIGNLSFTR